MQKPRGLISVDAPTSVFQKKMFFAQGQAKEGGRGLKSTTATDDNKDDDGRVKAHAKVVSEISLQWTKQND